jgi:hypothetical protein
MGTPIIYFFNAKHSMIMRKFCLIKYLERNSFYYDLFTNSCVNPYFTEISVLWPIHILVIEAVLSYQFVKILNLM